jgi:cell division initiation protein
MRITPLDIQKHRFRRKAIGLDGDEVRTFLQAVSEQFELVVRDNANYREEIANLREQLRLHEERERVLKDTLVTAQKAAVELRENARKDAEITVREAELKAERLMEVVKGRVAQLQAQISELKAVRKRVRERVASMWEEQRELLAAWAEEDKRDNLEILGPKKAQEAEG